MEPIKDKSPILSANQPSEPGPNIAITSLSSLPSPVIPDSQEEEPLSQTSNPTPDSATNPLSDDEETTPSQQPDTALAASLLALRNDPSLPSRTANGQTSSFLSPVLYSFAPTGHKRAAPQDDDDDLIFLMERPVVSTDRKQRGWSKAIKTEPEPDSTTALLESFPVPGPEERLEIVVSENIPSSAQVTNLFKKAPGSMTLESNLDKNLGQSSLSSTTSKVNSGTNLPKTIPPSSSNDKPRASGSGPFITATQLAMLKRGPVLGRPKRTPTIAESSSSSNSRNENVNPQASDNSEQAGASTADENDFSWMEEDPGPNDRLAQLRKESEDLSIKRINGKITSGELQQFFKLGKLIRLEERMQVAADIASSTEDKDHEDSLFVEQKGYNQISDARRRHHRSAAAEAQDIDNEENESLRSPVTSHVTTLRQHLDNENANTPEQDKIAVGSSSKKRKARTGGRKPKNAKEFNEREQEKQREKERKKHEKEIEKNRKGAEKNKKAPKLAASTRQRKNGTSKDVSFKAKAKPKAKSSSITNQRFNFNSGQNGDDMLGRMILNLVEHDPINDRLNDPVFDVDEEPVISGTVKATQLQRLYANVPTGTDRKSAQKDRRDLQEASRSFGYAKVKVVDGKWLVKGMKTTLYHHQLLGARWMIKRELSPEPPFGGILADSMGLGKTVQTLACMVGNPPGEDDRKRHIKATLIVVPASLINQWLNEIKIHCEEKFFPKIMHYTCQSHVTLEILQDLDIVLVSYSTVMKQFPFPDPEERESIALTGYTAWMRKASKDLGILHRIQWFRVVLDEAHAIKNNASRTSLACQNLKSVYRWCLTGTPILNSLEELFPYLRFLKANYSMDWKTFVNYFCDPEADDCNVRIATLLSYTMMRRTMSTTILGRPIITLPTPHPEVRYVQFSPEERIIYRITENRFRSNINAYFASKRKDTRSSYSCFLVQLLRLRQCTSHPFMMERTIKEAWTAEDLAECRSKFKTLKLNSTPFYKQCSIWVEETEAERAAAQAARDRGETVPETLGAMPFGRGKYGHAFLMDKAFDSLSDGEMISRVICSLCSDLPTNPTSVDCGHIFCKDCIMNYIHENAAMFEDDTYACPSCNKLFTNFTPYKGLNAGDDDGDDESPEPSNTASSSRVTSRQKSKKRSDAPLSKGQDMLGFEPKTKSINWILNSDHDVDFPLVPSAKTAVVKAMVLKAVVDSPGDKIVLYCQFRALALILGRLCQTEGWGFVYLTGDASLSHRDEAVQLFRDEPSCKILIAGLKCGGLGLNFPWANRCISLDLWWNHAVEQQAFGRIFRMGQKKETYLTRIVVRNSVDMRLMSMQMYKLKTCERAMQDGERKVGPALDMKDLARLFGFLREEGDGGVMRVESDYEDEEESEAEE